MKSTVEIQQRLVEIENEQAELSEFDFDAEMRQATINGGDLDAIEARQADTERRLKRLRIEAEALEGLLPDARREEAKPRIEAIRSKEKEHQDQARKAAEKARKAVAALRQAMDVYRSVCFTQDLRAEMAAIGKEIGLDLDLVRDISDSKLSSDLDALSSDLDRWASMVRPRGGMRFGDPRTTDLSEAA